MKSKDKVLQILTKHFSKKHIEAALKHFADATKKFQEEDWEGTLLKTGKFIEAILKSLYIYCGHSLPRSRQFKVHSIIKGLEHTPTSYDDTIRLLIPKACNFVYDIASNRGARHDPDEIDANKMDATVAIPVIAWILAELIRFTDAKSANPEETITLVEQLIEKKYPYFEEIDGRIYINIKGLSATETGLLLLNKIYPKRISRQALTELIHRHDYKKGAAATAVTRLRKFVDDDDDNWKLRGIGRQEAERLLSKKSDKK